MLLRGLTWLHRWVSIFTCLLLALWFASGFVMLYVPFPSLSDAQRVQHAEVVDIGAVRTDPASALQKVADADSLRLISVDGTPVYVARTGGQTVAIDARTGGIRAPLSPEAAARIAARFGNAAAQAVTTVEYDQWIVHQGFDGTRPYHRVALDDVPRSEIYVSAVTGEIHQLTTRRQRVLNGFGSVIHWIYFTPLRKHWSLWDKLVWWSSLVAVIGAVPGFVIGLYRFAEGRRRRGHGFGLFRGWWRWHHILGVFAGLFLLGWITSGWLSMDHERLFSGASLQGDEAARFRGATLPQVAAAFPAASLQPLRDGGYARLEFHAVGGRPFVLARGASRDTWLFAGEDGGIRGQLDPTLVLEAARAAWPGSSVVLAQGDALDALYRDAEGTPRSAIALLVGGAEARLLHVDARSAEPLAILDSSRRRYAWLYFGLHTWRLPGLADHDALRKALMMLALGTGLALSTTGLVLAWRRLRA